MRLIFIVLSLFIFTNCNSKSTTPSFLPVMDTVYVPIHSDCDSLKDLNDSLKVQLFLYKYQINQAKFYLNLCNKKPANTVYLRGWLNRAFR